MPTPGHVLGERNPRSFVEELLSVMYGDACAVSRLSESKTNGLVARLRASMAAPVNLRSVAADADVSQDAVTRQVGYLRDAYLLWSCPQASGPRCRVRSAPPG